jgi:hypothetical protein
MPSQLISQIAGRPSSSPENTHITRFNWLFLMLSGAGLLVSGILLFHIWLVYDQEPIIFDDDDGYLMNRHILMYQLDENRIRTYLELVLGKLIDSTPGHYNIDDMSALIDSRLIRKYTSNYYYSREQRARSNERRHFVLNHEIRRYQTDNPDLLGLVIRGELHAYTAERTTADLISTESQTTGVFQSQDVTYIVYLDRDMPSTANPWGLIISHIVDLTRPEVAQKVWESSPPLHGTSIDGNEILKFQRDSVEKTTQPKSPRTDATPDP